MPFRTADRRLDEATRFRREAARLHGNRKVCCDGAACPPVRSMVEAADTPKTEKNRARCGSQIRRGPRHVVGAPRTTRTSGGRCRRSRDPTTRTSLHGTRTDCRRRLRRRVAGREQGLDWALTGRRSETSLGKQELKARTEGANRRREPKARTEGANRRREPKARTESTTREHDQEGLDHGREGPRSRTE
jgi:hypothetical protein